MRASPAPPVPPPISLPNRTPRSHRRTAVACISRRRSGIPTRCGSARFGPRTAFETAPRYPPSPPPPPRSMLPGNGPAPRYPEEHRFPRSRGISGVLPPSGPPSTPLARRENRLPTGTERERPSPRRPKGTAHRKFLPSSSGTPHSRAVGHSNHRRGRTSPRPPGKRRVRAHLPRRETRTSRIFRKRTREDPTRPASPPDTIPTGVPSTEVHLPGPWRRRSPPGMPPRPSCAAHPPPDPPPVPLPFPPPVPPPVPPSGVRRYIPRRPPVCPP